MAKREYPVARVRVQQPGRRAGARYDGCGQHELLGDLVRQGRLRVAATDFAALGVPPPGGVGLQVPAAMLVDHREVNCLVARPCLDTSQSLGLGHFTTYGGEWVALPDRGLQREVQLFQYEGRGNRITGAMSNFTLPTNPVFALSLYRADPPPDFDWSAVSPYTEIHFGVGEQEEWALSLPYGGPMFLLRREGGRWQKAPNSERSVRVPSLEGFSAGQRLILWIAVWRGKLVVSTDGFAEDLWVYEAPGGPLRVREGKLAVWHNAGQFMFSCFPVTMPAAVVDSLPVEMGYETRLSAGQPILDYRHLPVINDAGLPRQAVQMQDTTLSRADLTVTQRAWRAVLAPYVWEQDEVGTDPETGEPVGFRTCVSPELYSVCVGQFAEVEELPAPELEDLSAAVKRVEGDWPDRLSLARVNLTLDNQRGELSGLEEYRRVVVELGRQEGEETEYEAVFDGYLVEPPPEVSSGGQAELEVTALDGLIRLRDEKADGRTPAFDGWPVREVFHWVLDRCGIPRERQHLEDTGVRLSLGDPEQPLWLAEPGRSWLEFLEEVAQFDYGAGVFGDAEGRVVKGCAHCRRLRTAEEAARHDGSAEGACPSEPDWHLYTRPQQAPQGQKRGAVLALARPRLSLRERDFVNYVAVCGVGPQGQPVRSVIFDAASLYDPQSDRYVGWRKMEVAALRNYTTQAEVNRLAQELFQRRSRRPEYLTLLTPLEPGMRVGQVIEVQGAEQVGAGGQRYRIVALNHEARRERRRPAVTWIKAKWLGAAPEPAGEEE